jgi:hypothetical protein
MRAAETLMCTTIYTRVHSTYTYTHSTHREIELHQLWALFSVIGNSIAYSSESQKLRRERRVLRSVK